MARLHGASVQGRQQEAEAVIWALRLLFAFTLATNAFIVWKSRWLVLDHAPWPVSVYLVVISAGALIHTWKER